MGLRMRNWVEKYRNAVQNEELIGIVNVPGLPVGQVGAWSFLKLAFLWSYAYYTYTPIIGTRYENMCYLDLFSGSGLNQFSDHSGNPHLILGSPLLMATIGGYAFKKCFFFEAEEKYAEALEERLHRLKSSSFLTCTSYEIFGDCNKNIDRVICELKAKDGCHFLLFVDPFSTEIKWNTMEKLLKMRYPAFDLIFNFQPFGINRKSYNFKTISEFLGIKEHESWKHASDKVLDTLENTYIRKLKQYSEKIKRVETIRIRSGTGSFYYDLIYATRKSEAPWAGNIDHLKRMIERLTGYEVSIIFDPTIQPLDRHLT